MAPLNKAEEISAVWRAVAAMSHPGEGWLAMPVTSGTRCILKAGRHFPSGDEAVLAGFRSVAIPVAEHLPGGKGFGVRRVSFGENGEAVSWIALQRLPAGSLEMFTIMAADVISSIEAMTGATEERLLSAFLARVRA